MPSDTPAPASSKQPSVEVAIAAFDKRDKESLSENRRKFLAKSLGGQVSYSFAWGVARDHGLGVVNEKRSEDQRKIDLVRAWLSLGNVRFEIIRFVAEAFKKATEAAVKGVLQVQSLINRILELIPTAQVEDIRSDVQAIGFQFRSVMVVG